MDYNKPILVKQHFFSNGDIIKRIEKIHLQ